MMKEAAHPFFEEAKRQAQEALELALHSETGQAHSQLYVTRTLLKRLSGDLPIVGRDGDETGEGGEMQGTQNTAFTTRSIEETRAWGWLELAFGVQQLARERPGASLVHFSRAWRVWRMWSRDRSPTEEQEIRREEVRARLWLGEAWARSFSDRAQRVADAVLRAALAEIKRLQAEDVLEETMRQQALLPPPPPDSPASSADWRHKGDESQGQFSGYVPYMTRFPGK